MAAARLDLLKQIPLLAINEAVIVMAESLIRREIIPERVANDALHISCAAVHEIDYLLTWNCRHIANARHRQKIENICDALGYVSPVICTPEELTEE